MNENNIQIKLQEELIKIWTEKLENIINLEDKFNILNNTINKNIYNFNIQNKWFI